jgi:SAM-dependent methyltransferase
MIERLRLSREGARRGIFALILTALALAGCALDRDGSSSGTAAGGDWTSPLPKADGLTTDEPSGVLFVEYVATPQDVVDRMLRLARIGEDDVVCDLGCGDGRIVVTAVRRYGCRAVGYDLDPLRVAEARSNARHSGVEHLVAIEQQDALTVDLDGVTVVALYMGEDFNARLIPQLRTLPAGARIVSHDFGLGGIPPDQTVEMTSRITRRKHTIHLWRCPLPPENP